jgi:hypothetical protein
VQSRPLGWGFLTLGIPSGDRSGDSVIIPIYREYILFYFVYEAEFCKTAGQFRTPLVTPQLSGCLKHSIPKYYQSFLASLVLEVGSMMSNGRPLMTPYLDGGGALDHLEIRPAPSKR